MLDKKYNIKLDLQFRCNNQTMKFNQFDNNTSDFFIKINNGGKSFNINKAIVVLVAIKPSGKVVSQFLKADNDLIYSDLKSNMVDEAGIYTAQAMLILEDERVVTDTITYEVNESKIISAFIEDIETQEDYSLLTDMLSRLSTIEISEDQRMINEAERILSEENRKIEEGKRVEAELIRQHEEADRTKYDATRESNENIRKSNELLREDNESIRIKNELDRISEESKRVKAEQLRKDNYNFMISDEERRRSEANTHKEEENLRVQAENNRVNEENKRRTTEQSRISAENARVSNENTRKSNEETRKSNENKRIEAETKRQNRYNTFIVNAEYNANTFKNYTDNAKVDEAERISNETDRKSQENRRVLNEAERISNENLRKHNETSRENNETSRQSTFNNKISEVNKKISEIDSTKNSFTSSINTKVDSKISEIETAKSDLTNTVFNKINEVENRFNNLTSKQQQDSEVIDARDGETSLKKRLDRDIEKAKQIYVDVNNSYISSESSDGYLKNVEILGNTVQDPKKLADIRSVGDKVEGQELYKIDITSCGKNVWKAVVPKKSEFVGGLFQGAYYGAYINGLKPNTQYAIHVNNPTIPQGQWVVLNVKSDKLYTVLNKDNTGSSNANIINNVSILSDELGRIGVSLYLSKFNLQEHWDTFYSLDVQLEEGNKATSYEPYQENKLEILSSVQLEKVGDVADRIICKDGVWGVEKNVKDFIIPGGLNWVEYTANIPSGAIGGYVTVNLSDFNLIVKEKDYHAISDKNIILKGSSVAPSTSIGMFLRPDSKNIYIKDYVSNLEEMKLKYEGSLIKYPTTQSQFIPLPYDQQVKLRTFAGQTNVFFNTEIAGQVKAQVPKSLGAVVNTHTEQIAELHNSLERVKKLEETTVSTVETGSNFTTVNETSNGYFEDVKLEGKTLVNTVNYDVSNFSTLNATIEEGNIFKLLWSSDENHSNIRPKKGTHNYKPNTMYTIVVNILENTAGVRLGISRATTCIKDHPLGTNFKNLLGVSTLPILIDDMSGTYPLDLYFCSWDKGGDLSKHIKFTYMILEGDHTNNPPEYFEGLMSVGQDVEEVSVESRNNDETQSNKKPLLYYNPTTETWEKPVLREWDTIEKHSDGKYYYHKRSGEVVLNGSESWIGDSTAVHTTVNRYYARFSKAQGLSRLFCDNFAILDTTNINMEGVLIGSDKSIYCNISKSKLSTQDLAGFKAWLQANPTTVVYQLAQEEVYECTNIDLMTYSGKTNYIINSGAISPKSLLKVHNNISNVVRILQEKVSLLESNVKTSQEIQDMMILESDIRILDMELALMEHMPIKLNLGENSMLRSLTYFSFLKNHIVNETYSKDYLENVMNKYLVTNRLTKDEYDELYKMLYPQNYNIELPIEY